MHTNIHLVGMLDKILEQAVKLGYARSKTEALILGIYELNNRYHLIESMEDELMYKVAEKIDKEIEEGKRKVLSEKEFIQKYRSLHEE